MVSEEAITEVLTGSAKQSIGGRASDEIDTQINGASISAAQSTPVYMESGIDWIYNNNITFNSIAVFGATAVVFLGVQFNLVV